MSSKDSEIKKFLKNQTILLTGATGFLGKILLEKLLRECDDVAKIYVIIRSKKNKTAEERFTELFNFPCFELIRTKTESLQKVTLVSGDCEDLFLSLNEEDLNILRNETTCVIHAAANVRFDQTLKESAGIVRAMRDLLELAKQMPKLKTFVHVSTAYSNCIRTEIKEQFYEAPMTPEDLLNLVNILDDDTLNYMTPKLLGEWPNTYVFAKCIAENLIKSAGKNLPISILRPAIVTSAMDEPIPGWVDNFYGLAGIVVGGSLGIVRSLNAKPDLIAKVVPVDYVANCILAVTWKTAQTKETIIYNYVGKDKYQITYQKLVDILLANRWTIPTIRTVWIPGLTIRSNKLWHKICVFGMLTIPAYIVDFVLFVLRKPTFAVKNSKRLNQSLDLTSYFTTRQLKFQDDNITDLWNNMTESDKKMFNFSLENVNWTDYGRVCLSGGRLYLLKDPLDSAPRARRKIWVLFVLHYALVGLSWYLLYRFAIYMLRLIIV